MVVSECIASKDIQYRLKKDFLHSTGTVFHKGEILIKTQKVNTTKDIYCFKNSPCIVDCEVVENSPEWFEKIEELKDELPEEITVNVFKDSVTIKFDDVNAFGFGVGDERSYKVKKRNDGYEIEESKPDRKPREFELHFDYWNNNRNEYLKGLSENKKEIEVDNRCPNTYSKTIKVREVL